MNILVLYHHLILTILTMLIMFVVIQKKMIIIVGLIEWLVRVDISHGQVEYQEWHQVACQDKEWIWLVIWQEHFV